MDKREREFVRCCLRARWEAGALDEARARSAEPGFDWAAVGETALRRGVAPLVYEATRSKGLLDEAVEQELRSAYYQTARRNVLLFHELEAVLAALNAAEIPVIVLKGAALAHTVYRNPAVRPMCDVDLLVQERDLAPALQQLAQQGYTIIPPLGYRSEVMVRKATAVDIVLELHWRLFVSPAYSHAFPLAHAWQSAPHIQIEGAFAQVLPPDALLLHLVGHQVLHHGGLETQHWLWLHDIAETLAHYHPQWDWAQVGQQARACLLLVPLQEIFGILAREWRSAPANEALRAWEGLHPLSQEQSLWQSTSQPHSAPARLRAELASLPWSVRLKFVWRNLFPPLGYMQHLYGLPSPVMALLYYPYRWGAALQRLWEMRGRKT